MFLLFLGRRGLVPPALPSGFLIALFPSRRCHPAGRSRRFSLRIGWGWGLCLREGWQDKGPSLESGQTTLKPHLCLGTGESQRTPTSNMILSLWLPTSPCAFIHSGMKGETWGVQNQAGVGVQSGL